MHLITLSAILYELKSQYTEFKIKSLKYCNEWQASGTLQEILTQMYTKKAFPATEADAGKLEQTLYSGESNITLNLTNFTTEEHSDGRLVL